VIVLCVPFQAHHVTCAVLTSPLSLSFLWAVVSIILSRFLLAVKVMEREAASKDWSDAATTTTLWRGHSGYWSRKSDAFELQDPL